MASTSESAPSNLSARRNKPGKPIPRLPLSAFSPPNSGTGDKFPLPPSPKTVHPTSVYDHVVLPTANALNDYSSALGSNLSTRLSGIVISVPQDSLQNVQQIVSSSTVPVLAVSVPLSDSNASVAPSSVKVVYNTTFTQSTPELAQAVRRTLDNGAVVEIDVQSDLTKEAGWEALEDFLTSVLADRDPDATKPAIVLSSILPPPNGLELQTVSLINHPSYQNYQGHTSTVSFNEPVYIRFSPPAWGAPSPSFDADPKTADEWKNRIRMYLGPIVEAFGFSRIIFASSNSSTTHPSTPENWYELARESVAELGIDQEGVDAIFGGNAKAVYSA